MVVRGGGREVWMVVVVTRNSDTGGGTDGDRLAEVVVVISM